jgi:predicted DNA-binding helix-hairpin-helix protein
MAVLDLKRKLAWALKHRGQFPLDLNVAEREQMLRVPGLTDAVCLPDRVAAPPQQQSLF